MQIKKISQRKFILERLRAQISDKDFKATTMATAVTLETNGENKKYQKEARRHNKLNRNQRIKMIVP